MVTERRIIRYDDLPAYLRDGWQPYPTQTGDGRFVTVWRIVAQGMFFTPVRRTTTNDR